MGSFLNFAPRERVQSTQFFGGRGYLVTFRQVDPLFTLDLSQRNQPTRVKELKIPSLSNEIHPLSEKQLFTG